MKVDSNTLGHCNWYYFKISKLKQAGVIIDLIFVTFLDQKIYYTKTENFLIFLKLESRSNRW